MEQKYHLQKTVSLFIFSILLHTFSLLGQSVKPDSAQIILHSAITEAQSSKRNVLIIFHATWCKWCTPLETALNDTTVKPLIDKNYVITMIDVMEREDKIQTYENPGGKNLLSDFGGDNAGLPFMVFLDGKGKMIANSNVMPQKQNIGYPNSNEEIEAFVNLLKETAPHMTGKQREVIRSYFERLTPQ